MLPRGRPCSTHVGVGYATAITVEREKKKRHKKKCFRLMFGKCYLGFVLSVGGMMKMMAARFAFRNI